MYNNRLNVKDSTPIMRYMNYQKFNSLLDSGKIYMNGILNFHTKDQDLLEGEIPDSNKMASHGQFLRLILPDIVEEISDNSEKKIKAVNFMEHFVCINCWTISKKENKRMWQSYAKDKNSVVIKSSVGRLRKAIVKDTRNIIIDRIKYVNHSIYVNTNPNPFSYCFLKDKGKFEWENELRMLAVCMDYVSVNRLLSWKTLDEYYAIDFTKEKGIDHIMVDCNINELIEEVIVSPFCDSNFKNMLVEKLEKHGIKAIVSNLVYNKGIF